MPADLDISDFDLRLARRLGELRAERGWSLDDLAEKSGVSRATLSRLERGESSPTAALLGRLAAAYALPPSRILAEAESAPAMLVRAAEQPVWHDRESGFRRRSVSPPLPGFAAELIEGRLAPGADILYDTPPAAMPEHHLWLLEGALEMTVDGETWRLAAGDCLRYRVASGNRFRNPGPGEARYLIVLCRP